MRSSSGASACGGSTRCRLDFHLPPLQRASRSPELIVKAPGSYGASCQPSCSVHTCRPPRPGSRSRIVTVPKSVCGPIRNWPGSGAPATAIGGYQLMFIVWVACPVYRVKKSASSPSAAAQDEQVIGELAHAGQVGHDGGFQRGHLGRVDVVLEPVPVDLRVARRLIGADGERLLHIRRSLRALGIAVRLDARRQPAPAADGYRVALLGLARRREERPRLRTHPRTQFVRYAMAGDQEKAHALQRCVDLSGDIRALRLPAAEPGADINHGN